MRLRDAAAGAGTSSGAEPERGPRLVRRAPRHVLTLTTYALVWAAVSVAAGTTLFLSSSQTLTLASHDAVLRPDFSGSAVVRTGPVLPDLRLDSGSRVGVDIRLGKTDAASTEELVERYAVIGAQPDGQIEKVRTIVTDLAVSAALRGGAIGLVPIGVWLMIGRARRRELVRAIPSVRGAVAVGAVAVVVVGLLEPWSGRDETVDDERDWVPLATFLGAGVPLPPEVAQLEVRGDVTTQQTRSLVTSAIDTYDRGKEFYADAAEAVEDLELRVPEEGDTVVALVSDRHDNIGMDVVARAIAGAGGAEAVFNAGDDTSTGSPWEAFSLDSVSEAFAGIDDRYAVLGNHDNGTFVGDYLAQQGWTVLDGEITDGPGETSLLGVPDPRSSGLGTWREETGLTFSEVGTRLADEACDAAEPVTTVLVHDANLADEVLERGCADLVLGGHLHVQEGPTAVLGENGSIGYSFTTGTTGGAAYAIAIGSKLRRTAQVTLVTYRDGSPLGLQSVLLKTNGTFEVDDFAELRY